MQFVALSLLIAVMLLCATCSQGVSAQNLSSMNNSNNSKTNLSGSSKTIIIPQGNKTLITTNPAAVGQTNNSQSTNRTGFSYVSNLMVKDKTFPIKYNITNGKLLGMVADKDKTTLVLLLGGTLDNGKLTIELPRNVLDSKSQGNTDTKYNVKIDNRGVDYKEAAANLNARILQIDFGKNDRMLEISGTQMTS
ncbi:MAG: hypothetical protein WBP64_00395 [Nitrososphaeraceae archaeon]